MTGDNTVEQESIFNTAASSTERNHHGGERRACGWCPPTLTRSADDSHRRGGGITGAELLLPISCSRGGSTAGGWLLTDHFLTLEPELCRRLLPPEPGPQLPVRASVLMRAKATGGRPEECSHRHNEAD